ncbi:MAG: pre-peptidase C-terminal domain-containing protein [Chitinophagaceae bacterium]|nr:pre-peptidase C-terminal domain-containing protein [Chitinophagaceae bacterium]
MDSSTTDHGIFTAIAAFCTEKNGFEYGTFNQTLGYSANGTSDDWLYGDQATKNKIYSFTIEVGKSFYPAPALIFPYCDSLLDANLKMLKMAASYAEAIETGSDTLHSLSAEVNFSIKRYSIKEKSFTVSLEPLGFPEVPIIVSGAPIVYNDLAFLEDRSGGSIRYTVPASTANGTVVRFLLKVDNGSWTVTDTITKIFIGHTALSLACENTAEPNENITQASALYPGIRVSAAIETSKDQDWFYIDNEIGKENIRILLSGLPSDFDMELRDPDGQVVAIAENAGLANDTIVFNTLRTGRYYLRIYGFHNAFDKYRCYSLSGTLGSGRFAEPVPGKFKKVSGGNTVAFSLSPVPANDEIRVIARSGKRQQIMWMLVDNTGKLYQKGGETLETGISGFSVNLRYLPTGVYLLKFFSKEGYWMPASLSLIKK